MTGVPGKGPICVLCGAQGSPVDIRCPMCDEFYPTADAPPPPPGTPAPAKKPWETAPERLSPKFEDPPTKFAWEVGVLLLLVGAFTLLNFISGLWPLAILDAAMCIGLFKREAWGWWLTFVIAMLGVMAMIFFMLMFSEMRGILILGVVNLVRLFVVIGLLILCRSRGAYFRSTGFADD